MSRAFSFWALAAGFVAMNVFGALVLDWTPMTAAEIAIWAFAISWINEEPDTKP